MDKCKTDGACYWAANGQDCWKHQEGTCPYSHPSAGAAAAPTQAPAPAHAPTTTTPKSTNIAQAMAMVADGRARGHTQAKVMVALTASDFFAGGPNVDLPSKIPPSVGIGSR